MTYKPRGLCRHIDCDSTTYSRSVCWRHYHHLMGRIPDPTVALNGGSWVPNRRGIVVWVGPIPGRGAA